MIIQCNYKIKDVINYIYKFDNIAFPEEKTNKEWYYKRYNGQENIYIVKNTKNKVIGYCTVFDIKKDLYDAFSKGILNGDMTVSHNMFYGTGEYFYIGSIFVSKKYRNKGIAKTLIKLIIDNYNSKNIIVLANKNLNNLLIQLGFEIVNVCETYNVLIYKS